LDTVPFETNETLFNLKEKPRHLIIIGGGPIGMEMAQAHVRLGCKVTVVEAAKALGKDDPEMAKLLLDRLENEGVTILEDTPASSVSGQAGSIEVQLGDGQSVTGTHLLVAVGRKPNTDGLNAEVAGIRLKRNGAIDVDASLRSSNRRIYAIGDVAGGPQFTHVAGYHAGVILRSALFGLPAKASYTHIPWATYTDPELAQIGLSEAQARKEYGASLEIVRFDFAGNDRLIAERNALGRIKLMVARNRPVGVAIVGPQAGELIAFWSLVMANKMTMKQISAMVAPYPTVAEINKRVVGAYFSPRLFESTMVKRVVRAVQRWLP
jgi:pyruvate/2-oxoglutarate dehydrogenase complex dihydrolipoamide dehydrogenase (E3) component